MAVAGIGVIGAGVVGEGVVTLLTERKAALERAAGRPIELIGVAARDSAKVRSVNLAQRLMTVDALLEDPRVEVVVEVAGGTEAPRQWVLRALAAGKAVVTANKALLAEHAEELWEAFTRPGARLYCEAAVAGGIPIVSALDRGLVANRVLKIEGILNGTCNYLLTQMERRQLSFDAALREAQAQGFAEADPTLDISGGDAAHKLAVVASLALGMPVSSRQIATEGIQRLTAFDLAWAERNGLRVKMLAIGRFAEGEAELRVHPTLVPRSRLISQVMDEFNAISVEGDLTGPQLYQGRGAGRFPTASAVVADIVQAVRGEPMLRGRLPPTDRLRFKPMDEVVSRHYLHLEVIDQPGVVARVARVLAEREISIASMFQPDAAIGKEVPLVLTTHPAKDLALRQTLETLSRESFLRQAPVHIRMDT